MQLTTGGKAFFKLYIKNECEYFIRDTKHRETDKSHDECFETLMKHEARVFDIVSKSIFTSLVIRGYCFSTLISHEIVCLKNNQNMGNLLLLV